MWTNFKKEGLTSIDCTCKPPPESQNLWDASWEPIDKFREVHADLRKNKNISGYREHHAEQLYWLNPPNGDEARCLSSLEQSKEVINVNSVNWEGLDLKQCRQFCGVYDGELCEYTPDVFLFSAVLA